MQRKGKDRDNAKAVEQARIAIMELRNRITQNVQAQQWGQVDTDMLTLMPLLRDTSETMPVTQSMMAELHGQWGLTLNAQRRYQEAYKHLLLARELLYADHESAVAWAVGENLKMEGEGGQIDLHLALRVLEALADSAVRLGQPGAGEVLQGVVEVADMVGDQAKRWEARQRLAAFTAGMADWQGLLELGREMGHIARQRHNLPDLLEGLRQVVEALVGLKELDQAIEAQRLVVDIARHLADPSLPDEEKEFTKLRASAR